MPAKKRNPGLDAGKAIKGLKIAIGLSLLFSAIVVLATFDEEAFLKAISSLSPLIILEILILLAINYITAGMEVKIMVKATGNSLSLQEGIKSFLVSSFASNVTPIASGGGPFQIYFLHKRGISLGQATTVVLAKFVLRSFYFSFSSLFFLLFFNDLISPGALPDKVFYICIILGFLIAVGIIAFCISPDLINYIIKSLFRFKKVRNLVRKNYGLKRLLVRGRKELREFHHSMELLAQHKKSLLLAACCTFLYWSSLFLIVPVILRGLGYEPNFFQSYIMLTIFNLIIPYMPTPGASGMAELGFASIFVSFIPKGIIGLVTFLWRFASFYLILIIGGFFTFRELGWERRKEKDNE